MKRRVFSYSGGEETLQLVGYADASHASDKKIGKGAYGYVFLLDVPHLCSALSTHVATVSVHAAQDRHMCTGCVAGVADQ
ncbi:unnamed protein product, partial [Closterium sp. Naga37s-1]